MFIKFDRLHTKHRHIYYITISGLCFSIIFIQYTYLLSFFTLMPGLWIIVFFPVTALHLLWTVLNSLTGLQNLLYQGLIQDSLCFFGVTNHALIAKLWRIYHFMTTRISQSLVKKAVIHYFFLASKVSSVQIIINNHLAMQFLWELLSFFSLDMFFCHFTISSSKAQ